MFGIKEGDLFVILQEREHVAVRPTRPAAIVLKLGIHLQRRLCVVVEGAEAAEMTSTRIKRDVLVDHVNNVDGSFYGRGCLVQKNTQP